MNWDDIRIFASVAQVKSFSKAAKEIGSTQATISRRIQKLEERLGYPLFDRGQGGCTLTTEGEKLVMSASEMASWAKVYTNTANQILAKEKTMIITCGPALAKLLSTRIDTLKKGTANVSIEINASPYYLDIEKGEADIAIRNKRPVNSTDALRIKKLNTRHFPEFSVYGNRKFFEGVKIDDLDTLNDYIWAGYTRGLANLPSAQWLRETIPDKQVQYKLSSNSLIVEVLKSRKTLAVLPRSLGEAVPQLVAVYGPVTSLETDIWMVRRNNPYDRANTIVARNLEICLKTLHHSKAN